MLLTFFIFIFSLVALYIYTHHGHRNHKGPERRNRKHKNSSTIPPSQAKNDTFHCVETHHHTDCCNAVKDLHGKRFLSAEAPKLPVTGCDKDHCQCDYIHHEDRRVEIRRDELGIQHDMYGQNGEVEHRDKRHGRRKTD